MLALANNDCAVDGEFPRCLNGGQCIDLVGNFSCLCQTNYTGHICQIKGTKYCRVLSDNDNYLLNDNCSCRRSISSHLTNTSSQYWCRPDQSHQPDLYSRWYTSSHLPVVQGWSTDSWRNKGVFIH